MLRYYLLEINLVFSDWPLCGKTMFQADEAESYWAYKWERHVIVNLGYL